MLRREIPRPFLKASTGIGRGHGKRRESGAAAIIDKSKYESPAEYKATTEHSVEFVKDPNGTLYHAETHERYSVEGHLAENPGFKAIRSAPIGSVVVVHQPKTEWMAGIGEIPAHDEYYEMREDKRLKGRKSLHVIHSTGTAKYSDIGQKRATIHKGYYISNFGADVIGGPYDDWRMGTVKDIQKRFKYSDRITIYKPKNS